MFILDDTSKTPLYIQLYEALKKDVLENHRHGAKLPSIRKISDEYKISKNTVESAYRQLYSEGYIESKPKSGYVVADMDAYKNYMFFAKTDTNTIKTRYDNKPYLYDFHPASLTNDMFPAAVWKKLYSKAISGGMDFGRYGEGRGEYNLRLEIANYLKRSRGVLCDATRVVVCAGFTDSMSILAVLLKERYDGFAVESPGYPLAAKTFGSHGYMVYPIDIDKNGIVIDKLEQSGAGLVYVTPSHQYPTGCVMPMPNRMRLLEWAIKVDGLIIEDDYDSELCYGKKPIPALQGLGTDDRVVYIGTFSKSLSPSLRVSYLVLPQRLVPIYEQLFVSRPNGVSMSVQATLALFMGMGHWDKHLHRVRLLARKKHDTMLDALKRKFGDEIEILSYGAGLGMLIKPKIDIEMKKLISIAKKQGIKLYPTTSHYGDDCKINGLFMGFGGLQQDEIVESVKLLKTAWNNSKII